MIKIGLIAFDGFTDIDLFLHWELLTRPVTLCPYFLKGDWSVKLLGTASSHTSASGMKIPMNGNISEAKECNAILHASGQATYQLIEDAEYLKTLALDPERQLVCSQCSGALILAASGLLKDLTATTADPTTASILQKYGAIALKEPFVIHDNRNIATAAVGLAGIEVARWILMRLLSQEAADICIDSPT